MPVARKLTLAVPPDWMSTTPLPTLTTPPLTTEPLENLDKAAGAAGEYRAARIENDTAHNEGSAAPAGGALHIDDTPVADDGPGQRSERSRPRH